MAELEFPGGSGGSGGDLTGGQLDSVRQNTSYTLAALAAVAAVAYAISGR